MKKKDLFLASGLLVAGAMVAVLICCSSTGKGASGSAGEPSSNGKTQKVEFLFVQNAADVSFANGSMTLHGVNPTTVCFADRPERIAGHMPTSKVIPMWGEGKNSFTKDPPNATLSMFSGDTVSNVVLELRNPQLNGSDLTYDVRVLEGKPPTEGGACSLFIDIIGMPLTPRSYAGAARRAARWGYPGVYGPAVVPVPVAAVPVPVY
jgi:hypothetical protein